MLDFPYVYKLDGSKLFCNAPSINSPTGCCEGVIDYDPGYNYLYCTKCGVKYTAVELQEAIENEQVIVKSKGESKMKISVKGGSKNVNYEKRIGEFSDMAKAMPSKPIKGKNNNDKYKKNYEQPAKKLNNDAEVVSEKKVAIQNNTKIKESVIKAKETHIEDNPVEVTNDMCKDIVAKMTTPKEEKKVISPIEFDESLIKEHVPSTEKIIIKNDSDEDRAEELHGLLGRVFELMDDIKDDTKPIWKEFKDKVSGSFFDIFSKDKLKGDNRRNSDDPEDRITFLLDEAYEIAKDEGFDDIIVSDILRSNLIKEILFHHVDISIVPDETLVYDKDAGLIYMDFAPFIGALKNKNDEYDIEFTFENRGSVGIWPDQLLSILEELGYKFYTSDNENIEECDPDSNPAKYGGYKLFAAEHANIKEIFPEESPKKVIVLLDDEGNYYTIGKNNDIIAIDMIGDEYLDRLSVVKAKWLNNLLAEKKNEESISKTNQKDAPVGVFAPEVAVNGVATEE